MDNSIVSNPYGSGSTLVTPESSITMYSDMDATGNDLNGSYLRSVP